MSAPEPLLDATERAICQAVNDLCQPGVDPSGHAIRQRLLRAGLDKGRIVATMHSLVARGVLERTRRDEADGRFYTAYRLSANATGHAPPCAARADS